MIFRQLFDRELSTSTYLIADERSREVVLIDPVLERVPSYVELINQLELGLVLALDTTCMPIT
jgi:sulfur dioxygenase